jgi:hypothetical protein
LREKYYRNLSNIANTISRQQWAGQPITAKDDDDEFVDTNAVCIDITEALINVGLFVEHQNLRPWMDDEIPNIGGLWDGDHHHNMVRRLSLLPPTYR